MAYPVSSQPSRPVRPMPDSGSAATGPARSGKSSTLKTALTFIIVVAILAGGVYMVANYSGLTVGGDITLKSNWQAVFLTNGQVYFGKVVRVDNHYISLANIYYLQVVTQPLQRSAEGEAVSPEQQDQRLTLIKLGNEIHGPRDEMYINRDQVVIIEDLKEDGRVVQAINDYVKNQAQPAN